MLWAKESQGGLYCQGRLSLVTDIRVNPLRLGGRKAEVIFVMVSEVSLGNNVETITYLNWRTLDVFHSMRGEIKPHCFS